MINEHSYGAVIFYVENNRIYYLLIQHSSNFHWGFSRGLKENHENGRETATREIKEETNLEVEFIDGFENSFVFFYKWKGNLHKKEVTYYVAKSNTKQVKLSWEHKDFTWLEFNDALKKLDYEKDKETLKKAHNFLKTKYF